MMESTEESMDASDHTAHNEDDTCDSDSSQLSSFSVGVNKQSKPRWKRSRRGGKRSNKSGAGSGSNGGANSKLDYRCTNFIKEDHKQPIFGVRFYEQLLDGEQDPLIFGTVGSNRASIYQCGEDCGRINLYQSYVDADPEECFYTCTWTYSPESGDPLFCFAGGKAVIHVLNAIRRQFISTFQGHGGAINELKTHPIDPALILSTSKDHTLRLWNIKTEVCVAIFGGVDGHRDEVLSIDFNITGTRIVSCGMDHSLKFWSLESEKIKKVIEQSHAHVNESKSTCSSLSVHYPEFTTRDVHRNYVDCCIWLGDLVLSKSCDNQVVCWKPKLDIDEIMKKRTNTEIGVFVLHKFDITQCDIWFIKFAVDYQQTVLALGNQVGKIYLYDLDVDHPSTCKPAFLQHNRCNTAVRQISFSLNAKILIAVCDDGTIWRWDRQS